VRIASLPLSLSPSLTLFSFDPLSGCSRLCHVIIFEFKAPRLTKSACQRRENDPCSSFALPLQIPREALPRLASARERLRDAPKFASKLLETRNVEHRASVPRRGALQPALFVILWLWLGGDRKKKTVAVAFLPPRWI
jgi:hypothetical protein